MKHVSIVIVVVVVVVIVAVVVVVVVVVIIIFSSCSRKTNQMFSCKSEETEQTILLKRQKPAVMEMRW